MRSRIATQATGLALWLGLGLAAQAEPAVDPKGYLDATRLEAMSQAFPLPPLAGSPRDLSDRAASDQYRGLEGTERWLLATSHVELRPPVGLQAFDCTLGFRLSTADAPALTRLMGRLLLDANGLAEKIKSRAHRPRPVKDPMRPACQKITREGRDSPSYPSGSAAVAAAYGEALAEMVPQQATALRQAASQVALSRVICGMHYPWDVEVGETVGRTAWQAARVHPDYQADQAMAQTEIAVARALGLTSPACAAERAALTIPLP